MADALNQPPHRHAQPGESADGIVVVADTNDPRAVVLHVSGEVDMLTAPVLAQHARLHFSNEAGKYRPLVFDMADVGFLGSAGLAVLAEAANQAAEHAGAVWVVATSRTVLRPLQVTGLDSVLRVHTDVTAAIEALSACSGDGA